jgi:predicted O-linked N-acetylglucosamine transferase (SPINDLY family)
MCDWEGIDSSIDDLVKNIERGEKASPPFMVLSLVDCLRIHRKSAEIFVRAASRANGAPPAITRRSRHDRIRLGYFSADYHAHATSRLMAGLFEQHDRARFEIVAFSFGPDQKGAMRDRLAASFDRFIDVRDRSDRDVALLARNLEIDIAVDLKGFTTDSRWNIFAHRAAPLQVNYLGYPGTMGADYMDYIIADSVVIPDGSQKFYSENMVCLPHSYQANDRKRPISGKIFSRQELCLPDTGFVYCCFNNNYKITPAVFDSWMRILGQVQGSVLWLLADNPWAERNLRREAAARGVNPGRLVVAGRLPAAEHLARQRAADLFIDTLPYNAHTTASDALWAGLPVLTRAGTSFPSRVAASLLTAADLPELITTTPEHYERRAIELARNPEELSRCRARLARNRLTTPLFDTGLFARHIEAAYVQMYERYQAGLAPAPIRVAPS